LIKVAFWYDRPQEYTGGLNYLRNLLYALSLLEDKKIKPYIFFGKKVDADIVNSFGNLATVVRTSILDRKSPAWFLHQVLQRIFHSLKMVDFVIRRHGISIVSHAEHLYSSTRPFHIISWIPDFQYLHLPHLFPGLDTVAETKRMQTIAAQSDMLILSSYAALKDYQSIADPDNKITIKVLQFDSQPSGTFKFQSGSVAKAGIEDKYGFKGKFFFLPNQFWQHKNHLVVFSAVKALKNEGKDVLVLCTGNMRDYRLKDSTYIDSLTKFIDDNDLNSNIRILGAIDYADVLLMMRCCVAVINPSRFEGWSSTVEEAKSIGKLLLLSDIPVHREQNPTVATFFEPDDSDALARAMALHWTHSLDLLSEEDQLKATEDLKQRTIAYAEGYSQIVLELEHTQLNKHKQI
jgi:glycosyltransferase involved in cell wall biosynthesis